MGNRRHNRAKSRHGNRQRNGHNSSAPPSSGVSPETGVTDTTKIRMIPDDEPEPEPTPAADGGDSRAGSGYDASAGNRVQHGRRARTFFPPLMATMIDQRFRDFVVDEAPQTSLQMWVVYELARATVQLDAARNLVLNDLSRVLHEAFEIATNGRPGPVVVDIPKDVQFQNGSYHGPQAIHHRTYRPKTDPDTASIVKLVEMMAAAERPVFYTGGGIINSGPEASKLLRELVDLTGFPITSTLMGLGAFPASRPEWLGMLGMHGTWEANHVMHDCDLMINLGARFDDRCTGKVSAFSPASKKVHIDIDASQINKIVRVDLGIVSDATKALREIIRFWKAQKHQVQADALKAWWKQIDQWRTKKSLAYRNSDTIIKPQYAIDRLYELTKHRKDVFITTEVGQHQMWAAQRFHFEQPNHWMTSGGLGTMGYGLPAAVGVQMAHPDALVIDIAGEASVQMTMQEMSTAVQYNLPIKIFILNNEYMGMVRQWQEILHGGRYSHSYSEALPDFVKMAEAFGCVGLRATKPSEMDDKIKEMLSVKKPVLFDVRVDPAENCYPMIPSGAAHNEMLLSPDDGGEISDAGKMLV